MAGFKDADNCFVVAPEPLKVKLKSVRKLPLPPWPKNTDVCKDGFDVAFEGKIGPIIIFFGVVAVNSVVASEAETASNITSLVPFAYVYPPPANTLQTVTEPALFRYSLTVCGTNVSELKGPNFLS